MLSYIMLNIMLAYLMLFTALFNAVCIMLIYFLPFTFANASYFHALFFGYSHIVCLFKKIILHHVLCF